MIHVALSSLDPLPSLLQLQPQQVRLGAADSSCAVAVPLVKRLAALVERVNKFGALGLVVSVFRQAVWELHKQARRGEGTGPWEKKQPLPWIAHWKAPEREVSTAIIDPG